MPIVTVEVFSTDALRWDALTHRDQQADGAPLCGQNDRRLCRPHDCRIVTMSAFPNPC